MGVRNSVSWRSDVSRTRSAGPHIQAKLSADSADSLHRVTNNRNLSQSCQVDFKPFFQTKILFCLKTFPVKGETDSTGNSKVKQPHPVSGPLADHYLLHLLTHYQHEVGVNKKYLVLSLLRLPPGIEK